MSKAQELAELRPLRIEGDICYVPLTKGYEAIIDSDQAPLLGGRNWCALVTQHNVYAMRSIRVNGKCTKLLLHRLVAGTPDGMATDHINGDGLDNRRANLRIVTVAQNNKNLQINRANTSGVRGVSWHKKLCKWWAAITVNGKKKHIGYFSEISDAAAAYNRESLIHHGEFGGQYARAALSSSGGNES